MPTEEELDTGWKNLWDSNMCVDIILAHPCQADLHCRVTVTTPGCVRNGMRHNPMVMPADYLSLRSGLCPSLMLGEFAAHRPIRLRNIHKKRT